MFASCSAAVFRPVLIICISACNGVIRFLLCYLMEEKEFAVVLYERDNECRFWTLHFEKA